ncbi:MAG: prolyl aminopeptidase [Magnetovibrionaceae bacterium]
MDGRNDLYDLYPRIEPFEQGVLGLDGGHEMYWEQSGNPYGTPVVFLHGGPGAGSGPIHRRFFDPSFYRIVVLDQRGAGRSRPYASIENNTTQHLINDLERLRGHLGIDRWLVFGGSWGSALGLAYGIAHPTSCLGFVLRGIFLGRTSELDWFMNGMRMVFPEAWRGFMDFLDEDERQDPLESYFKRLTDPDPMRHLPAAHVWSRYESACSNLLPRSSGNFSVGIGDDPGALTLARIEAHYFRHGMFMDDDLVLGNLNRIRHLPAVLVQGRYDMVCPIITADELSRAWPEARYVVVPDAGHSAMEPGVRSALVRATDSLKDRL